MNAQSSSLMEDNSPAIVTKNPAGDTLEGLWPPPVDNTEEHLEPRVNEVSFHWFNWERGGGREGQGLHS